MDFLTFDFNMILRLIVAVVLGGLIGLERDENNHAAGLRTHMIVCLGAALVMVVGESMHLQTGSGDIMRLGAQVISGIGFLGAGCIIADRGKVRGITTAAGLWTTACVGLAVGSGQFVLALVVVALMLIIMWALPRFRKKHTKTDTEAQQRKD